MPNYRVLKSVAHNIVQSFVSMMSWRNGDYAMGHLLAYARTTKIQRLQADLLTGTVEPSLPLWSWSTVRRIFRSAHQNFPDDIAKEGGSIRTVSQARIRISFDLDATRPKEDNSDIAETPYVVEVTILDDRGVSHTARQSGWEFPEPDLAS